MAAAKCDITVTVHFNIIRFFSEHVLQEAPAIFAHTIPITLIFFHTWICDLWHICIEIVQLWICTLVLFSAHASSHQIWSTFFSHISHSVQPPWLVLPTPWS